MVYIKALFSGRIGVRNFCLGYVFLLLVLIIPPLIFQVGSPLNKYTIGNHFFKTAESVFVTAYSILAPLFALSLNVRRVHDLGYSGLYALIYYVPIFNLLKLYILFEKGEESDNVYGSPVSKSKGIIKDIFAINNYQPKTPEQDPDK
jgi:uncharacterized membrane protein YhaH (DUF805 family)